MVWCDAFLCRICLSRICLLVAVNQKMLREDILVQRYASDKGCIFEQIQPNRDQWSAEASPSSNLGRRPLLAAIIRAEACVWAVLPPPCCLSAPVQPLRHHRRPQQ